MKKKSKSNELLYFLLQLLREFCCMELTPSPESINAKDYDIDLALRELASFLYDEYEDEQKNESE